MTKNNGVSQVIKTGFIELDNCLNGLQKGELYVVASRPSMGKTAFATNIASHALQNFAARIVFFSMEMTKEALQRRMQKSDKLFGAAYRMTERFFNDVEIDGRVNLKASEIREKCQELAKESEIDLIIIDQLTEMWRPLEGDCTQEHEENARAMKRLAVEMNCPVVLIQQLQGGVALRGDNRPTLSEVIATNGVADTILILYRDSHYDPDSEKKNIAEVIIAKSRNTNTDVVELVWIPQYTMFCNMEKN